MPYIAAQWNATHPNEKVTIKQQSDQADQQLSDLEQHFQAKDPGYDVVTVDVVWTRRVRGQGLDRSADRHPTRSTPARCCRRP